MDDKRLRRAGLDYHEFAQVKRYPDLGSCLGAIKPTRVLACTTNDRTDYHKVRFQAGDALLIGPETRGLPANIRIVCHKNRSCEFRCGLIIVV